ncbi:hypothetical protein [Microvirga sp. M2]|uniref:hypothetical protein n=1 Tax=Microvirga sp. M2 TaxID=3073270 RepID=UPI0039C00705
MQLFSASELLHGLALVRSSMQEEKDRLGQDPARAPTLTWGGFRAIRTAWTKGQPGLPPPFLPQQERVPRRMDPLGGGANCASEDFDACARASNGKVGTSFVRKDAQENMDLPASDVSSISRPMLEGLSVDDAGGIQ